MVFLFVFLEKSSLSCPAFAFLRELPSCTAALTLAAKSIHPGGFKKLGRGADQDPGGGWAGPLKAGDPMEAEARSRRQLGPEDVLLPPAVAGPGPPREGLPVRS